MKWRWAVCLFVCVGCTSPNPKSCLDGACTDPRYPFCDVDGTITSEPAGTCVAVTCTAGEFAGCREDAAVTCNSTGNNYDLLSCPHGCGATGCNGCTTDAQCANPVPICDGDTRACRSCEMDDECTSGLCDGTGACVDSALVVHASPTGLGSGTCSKTEPCTVGRAVMLATNATTTPTIKLKAGVYTTAVQVRTPTAQQLRIVGGTGVKFSGVALIVVGDGANVAVSEIEVEGSPGRFVDCGDNGTSTVVSTLVIEDVKYQGSGLAVLYKCRLTMNRVEMTVSGSTTIVDLGDDSQLRLDRTRLISPPGTQKWINTLAKRLKITATNSVFDNVLLLLRSSSDLTVGDTSHFFAFNTFIYSTSTGDFHAINCRPGIPTDYPWTARFENNIIYAPSDMSAIGGPHCQTKNNLIMTTTEPLGTNIIGNPQFVNLGAKDFRLMATSPAKNAAAPSADLTTDHDFDGTMRPQGGAHDIGAFEAAP